MDKQAKIYVTNHQERAGSAIYHYLLKQGYENVVVRCGIDTGKESIQAMNTFFAKENIEYVFMTDGYEYAEANTKAELQARRWQQANVLEASARYNVKKLLYLGDIHVYPKYTPQPLKETFLQRGIIDEIYAEQTQVTREGIALCRAYNRASNTNFHIAVAPRMYTAADMNRQDGMVADAMQRCMQARDQWQAKVEIPEKEPAFQELIYGEDLASGCVFVMNHYNEKGPRRPGVKAIPARNEPKQIPGGTPHDRYTHTHSAKARSRAGGGKRKHCHREGSRRKQHPDGFCHAALPARPL